MSQLKVNSVVDASGGNTSTINSMTPTADSLQGFRNRLINGSMAIDQRNAGAAVTVNTDVTDLFPVDRFYGSGVASDGVFTLQQSTTATTGFNYSVKATVTTADASIPATGRYIFAQKIEGYNVADLGFGTANAKTVTLSFWVQSSLTGTFSGSLRNSAVDRSYPFTYTISAANTWEQKSVTIAGDTSGTWLTTNGAGLLITWSLGTGSSRVGTAGAWAGANYFGATGETALIGTLNATWYITGAQLEVGSVATPFERRDYGRELIMCQRYFFVAVSGSAKYWGMGQNYSASALTAYIQFPVTMRAAPTSASTTGTNYYGFYRNGTNDDFNSITLEAAQVQGTGFFNNSEISGTAGQSGNLYTNNASSFIAFQAEL